MSFELILPFLRPIEPLLLDESVSEIMGKPDSTRSFERDGILCRDASVEFDASRLRTGLKVVANRLGKKLDEDNPLLNAQLPDWSRLAQSLRIRRAQQNGAASEVVQQPVKPSRKASDAQ